MSLKKCPYCAEEIQNEAILCRHCHNYLDGRNQEQQKGQTAAADTRFDRYINFLQQRYPSYQVVSKNYQENFLILNKKNDHVFSCLIFLLLLFVFVIPAVIYALFTLNTEKIVSVTITFDSQGNPISASRKDYQWLVDTYNSQKKSSS